MNWKTENQQQAVLEQELQGEGYVSLLQQLQQNAPFLLGFNAWEEVIAYMRKGTSCDTKKDAIFRAIFRMHRRDSNPCWRTILLVMFWPGLRSIHHQKQYWDTDPDELWQNMVWVFLQVICKIDVAKRPERLAQKVINDTVHRLCDIYRRKWKIAKTETSLDNEAGEVVTGAKDDIDYAGIELRIRQESAIRHLRKYLAAGRISEADFLLIVGTRIYGKSVVDYASEVGMNYELARKRRIRAEAKLRPYKHNA